MASARFGRALSMFGVSLEVASRRCMPVGQFNVPYGSTVVFSLLGLCLTAFDSKQPATIHRHTVMRLLRQ